MVAILVPDVKAFNLIASPLVSRKGFIEGRVTELGIPVVRRVICYHRRTGVQVGSTYSNANGYYRIDGLIPNAKYYVTSIDNNSDGIQYNAVTQDLISASGV